MDFEFLLSTMCNMYFVSSDRTRGREQCKMQDILRRGAVTKLTALRLHVANEAGGI